MPAFRNFLPMRSSRPIARAIVLMLPPASSQKFATSLIKLILVARKEFAAYLMISALFKSVNMSSLLKRLYKIFIKFLAFGDSQPMTILSGWSVSLIADPSRKNSGFETVSKVNFPVLFVSSFSIIFLHKSPVPTGTVDLLIKIL